jgi:hypothetical protein
MQFCVEKLRGGLESKSWLASVVEYQYCLRRVWKISWMEAYEEDTVNTRRNKRNSCGSHDLHLHVRACAALLAGQICVRLLAKE